MRPIDTNDDFIGPPPRAVKGLSWGALLFSPFWQLRNGFWISAVLYVACAFFVWPIAHVIAVVFFFRGTRWSWSKGQRWRSYSEFCDSQFSWNFLALVAMCVAVIVLSLEALSAQLSREV